MGVWNISSYFTLILNGNNSIFPAFWLQVAFSCNVICMLWILYFNSLILLKLSYNRVFRFGQDAIDSSLLVLSSKYNYKPWKQCKRQEEMSEKWKEEGELARDPDWKTDTAAGFLASDHPTEEGNPGLASPTSELSNRRWSKVAHSSLWNSSPSANTK